MCSHEGQCSSTPASCCHGAVRLQQRRRQLQAVNWQRAVVPPTDTVVWPCAWSLHGERMDFLWPAGSEERNGGSTASSGAHYL